MSSQRSAPARPVVELADGPPPRGPWVYGRRVRPRGSEPAPGELVEVVDVEDRFLGHALYNGGSDVRLRWIARGKRSAMDRPAQRVLELLSRADRLRRRTLRLDRHSDAYRIAHAEGDDLPGLIVDRLGSALVCEYHSLGWWRLRGHVEDALAQLYPDLAVHHRVPRSALDAERFPQDERRAIDSLPAPREVEITEHGLRYPVVPGGGHKTGWFCDQRENRRRVAEHAEGRTVLDICCNAGGFSLHAARAGARRVVGVDLDEVALARAERAAERNGLDVEWVHQDGFDTLRELEAGGAHFNLVVLDPHKLARGRGDVEPALRRYADWNALAIGRLARGGLLATFSCSGAVPLERFLGTVFSAARRAGREVQLLEVLGAGPDHPQTPDWARSRYLKGALLTAR
jgi:23S rRNA (cytosine1962-C5)-methyltransferase